MTKNSAPEKWEYREHTRVKHILLENYLSTWITILGRWNPKICYFDGFAGKGEYEDGTLGSPIIALKTADIKANYFDKLICVFIEKDECNYKNLEKILDREKPNIRNWGKIDILKVNGEFANVIEEIFNNLEKEESFLIPSFFFIDPFGFSGVSFEIIKKIISNPKTEVFFTFMISYIARFIGNPTLTDTFTKLFGTDEWKSLIQLPDREKALIELYRKQLHAVGGAKFSWHFRVCESKKLKTMYYLIHATNNFKGHSIMKQIMFKQGPHGSFAYLGPKDIPEQSQMRLFDIYDIGQLKSYLMEKFKAQSLTYNEILEKVCYPWYEEPPYIERDYRKALKELEIEEKIKIENRGPKGGINNTSLIIFPSGNPTQITLPISVTNPAPAITPKVKIYYKEYQNLDGTKEILVERVDDGSIIKRFDKTPLPKGEKDVVCPHFLELKWAYGCPYNCSWCYLKGTFRFRPEGTLPVVKPYEKITIHVRKFLEEVKNSEILNTGEIADSLMHENNEKPFSKFIIPIFEAQNQHKVLFLTKSSNVENLLEIESHDQVVISFSLNAIPVAEKWEKAPSILRRIEAAKRVFDAGYEVRLRIDPMVPIEDWEKHYLRLLKIIFDNLTPERITFGSLRGLQSTINGCIDKTWVRYLKESSNWGKKIDFKTRYDMYFTLIQDLKHTYKFDKVALCKETVQMWNALRLDYKNIKCNCVR